MIETLSRVIHPGWLTVNLENESTGEWFVYHRCVNCGYVAPPAQPGRDPLMEHTAREHRAGILALELHQFRSALHALHSYWGLKAFEWPDTNGARS